MHPRGARNFYSTICDDIVVCTNCFSVAYTGHIVIVWTLGILYP